MRADKLILFCCLVIGCKGCSDFQQREFLKRELSGPMIKLEDIHHGQFDVTIIDNKTKDTVRYALRISKFIKQNDIQIGDSISKEADSRIIWFYRKNQKTALRYDY